MVFSLHYVQTKKTTTTEKSWGCGGAMQGASPNGAHLGLHSKPLDAAILLVLALHCCGGRHG